MVSPHLLSLFMFVLGGCVVLFGEKSLNMCHSVTTTVTSQATSGQQTTTQNPSKEGAEDIDVVPVKTTKQQPVCKDSLLPPLPTLRNRVELGILMEQDESVDYKIGVELGVQKGHFSRDMLLRWKKATEYWLVDVWQQQTNYVDIANVDNKVQDVNYQETLKNTAEWKSKIKVCRN